MDDDASTFFGKQLIFTRFGPPAEVLRLKKDFSISSALEPGQVLVRILAAPLNPADLNTIEGTYGVQPLLPATPGIEGCGVVAASASGDFAVGDRVMFLRRASTWASHTTLPAEALFKLPQDIDPLQAAMLKVNPATAWQLLHGFGALKQSDWIVQNAGNSAVGRCVIQLARGLGIRTISFVRRAELCEELRDLGADHVFLDDDTGLTAAQEILGGANAAVAYNAVGGDSALRLMKLLRQSGTHITYGAMGRKPVTIPNGLLIFRDIRVRGLWVTQWIESAPVAEIHAVYGNLATLVESGKLIQLVDSTYPLEEYHQALSRLETADRSGKILFVP